MLGALACGAAACNALLGNERRTLDTGDDVTVDGLGGLGDSAADDTSDTLVEALSDAHFPAAADASVDAAVGDVSADSGCGTTVFWATFDEGGLPWATLNGVPPGIIRLSDAASVSPPFSMYMSAPNLGPFNPYVYVDQNLPPPGQPVRSCVDFDLFVSESISGTDNDLFGLAYSDGSGFLLYLQGNPSATVGCLVVDIQSDAQTAGFTCPGPDVPMGRWVHLGLELTMSNDAGSTHLKIVEDQSTLLFDGDLRPPQIGNFFHMTLSTSADQAGDGSWSVYFDNVRVSQ
jgi:hypothetical protein